MVLLMVSRYHVTETAAASQVGFGVRMKDLAMYFYFYGVPAQKCISV